MEMPLPRNPRFDTNVAVTLTAGDYKSSGVMIDLDEHGAKISEVAGFSPNDSVFLHVAGLKVAARVAWCDERQVGLAFSRPFPEDKVAGLHAQVKGWVTY